MSLPRTVALRVALGAVALAYLVVLYVSGAPPTHENRVASAVAGLLGLPPERIMRIEVERGGNRTGFRRAGSGWQQEGAETTPAINTALERALGLLHRAPPIRILRPEQTAGLGPATYGLDPPAMRIAIGGESASGAFEATFGDPVSDGSARYLRVAGRPETFIVSGFLYETWSALAP